MEVEVAFDYKAMYDQLHAQYFIIDELYKTEQTGRREAEVELFNYKTAFQMLVAELNK